MGFHVSSQPLSLPGSTNAPPKRQQNMIDFHGVPWRSAESLQRLKKICRKRPRLRLVVASATLDAGAFLPGSLVNTTVFGLEGWEGRGVRKHSDHWFMKKMRL